jgi:hypothetical protein
MPIGLQQINPSLRDCVTVLKKLESSIVLKDLIWRRLIYKFFKTFLSFLTGILSSDAEAQKVSRFTICFEPNFRLL